MAEPSDRPWHSESPAAVLRALGTSASGLSPAEASQRLARDGPNAMPSPPSVSAFAILIAQLKSVVVALLACAIVISVSLGDHVEALAIVGVLITNTAIGFLTERRARRAIEGLADLDVPRATVLRAGTLATIDAREIVAGDVVEVTGGRLIPADGRLIRADDLRVDEAALTGESMPVSKSSSNTLDPDAPLADRTTMIFKGTMALAGVGRAVITATGRQTEVGRIGTLTASIHAERTPLERQLDKLGTRLVFLTLGVAAVVALLGVWQGMPLSLVVQTALALAIAAVPEALPAVATIALAVGVHRMAKRRALVRYLPAVESLGATTVICTDKTRTLTSGDMRVVRLWAGGATIDITDRSSIGIHGEALIRAAVNASRQVPEGSTDVDPVDAAMWMAGAHIGLLPATMAPATAFVPFSSDRKWMAAFHQAGERFLASVKGAPRAVLNLCAAYVGSDGEHPIDGDARALLHAVNEELAHDGLRVLAVATAQVDRPGIEVLTGLRLLGFVGLADPPAPGVKETVGRLRAAGLRTVMLTGDQRATAESIGRSLGILDSKTDRALDGRELDRMTDVELSQAVRTHAAFTRVTPEHKLAIVRALRRQGEIVAMLGDGINDAAALRQADVGVAMGRRGTDVAKQAASVVLQDDRFETIAAAVEDGRVIFDNIRKFVFYLFSCNAAEVLLLLIAGAFGLPLPLLPLQLLWLNLLTDTFPALALAVERGDPGIMQRPPRSPRESILSRRFIAETLIYAVLITGVSFGAFLWALGHSEAHAVTVAFMTLGLAQVLHLGNARSDRAVLTLSDLISNPFAVLGAGVATALLVVPMAVLPLGVVLHLVPLSSREWLVTIAAASVPALAGQVWKRLMAPSADNSTPIE